jgi:hypothetical protein
LLVGDKGLAINASDPSLADGFGRASHLSMAESMRWSRRPW